MRLTQGVPRRGTPVSFLLLACLLGGLRCLGPAALAADELSGALDRGRFPDSERRQIQEFFGQAAGAGIPEQMLLPRLQEAVAKAAPADRLLAALERERAFLVQARELLLSTEGGAAQLADPASWARTANLLNSGLPRQQVAALVRASARRPAEYRPATYLHVALLDWGLSAEAALPLVEAVLASPLAGRDFPAILDLLADGRARRLPLGQTLQRLAEELPRARSLQDLRRRLY